MLFLVCLASLHAFIQQREVFGRMESFRAEDFKRDAGNGEVDRYWKQKNALAGRKCQLMLALTSVLSPGGEDGVPRGRVLLAGLGGIQSWVMARGNMSL